MYLDRDTVTMFYWDIVTLLVLVIAVTMLVALLLVTLLALFLVRRLVDGFVIGFTLRKGYVLITWQDTACEICSKKF